MALGADLLTRVSQPVQFIWGTDDPMGHLRPVGGQFSP